MIVDNGAPEGVYMVDPVKDKIVQGTITLKALATDYVSGVTGVNIYVNSVPSFNCVATLVGGTWQCSFNSATLPDGQHSAYAVATDKLGQTTTSASVPFIIDNNAPSTPVLSIYPTTNGYDTDGVVTWKWTDATDAGSGIDYYVIEIGSPVVYQSKVFGTIFTISDLSETSHCAKVKAVDKAGHESAWSSTACTIVDKTPPSPVSIGVDTETVDKFAGGVYYDRDGEFDVIWSGGSDAKFDHFQLYENGAGEYQDTNYRSTRFKEDGTYKYYVTSNDLAGWTTKSGEVTVVVDTHAPVVDITNMYPGIGFFLFTYTATDADPSSGIDSLVVSGIEGPAYGICSGTLPTGFCTVFMGTAAKLTACDKAGNCGYDTTLGNHADITPPTIIYSSPSGVIKYNQVTINVTTDEAASCYYSDVDDLEGMDDMISNDMIHHSVSLGTLADGLYVYHVQCEDMSGNMMDHSKTIVFYVNTDSQYCYRTEELKAGWNTFFLPQLVLDDINFNCGSKPYATEDVLSSMEGKYSIIWYYDGQNWLSYDPMYPEYSTLTQFNDQLSNPYYIKLTEPVKLGLQCDQGCQKEVTGGQCVEGEQPSWAIYKDGLYWAWASPCDGGCSQAYPNNVPGWRYATVEEWANRPLKSDFLVNDILICGSQYFDNYHTHCDYENPEVRVPYGGYYELWFVTDCTNTPVCGNDVTEIGEECDDANTVNGDGCSDTCLIESAERSMSPEINTYVCDDGIDNDGNGLIDCADPGCTYNTYCYGGDV